MVKQLLADESLRLGPWSLCSYRYRRLALETQGKYSNVGVKAAAFSR
jgi:hypothetical protein